MYLKGIGTEQDITKAKELFMKAAALGHVFAILALKMIDNTLGNTTPSFTPPKDAYNDLEINLLGYKYISVK